MRILKGLIVALGLIGLLALFGLLLGYYLYSLTPQIQTRITLVLPDEKSALAFEEKIATFKSEIEEAVENNQKKEVNLQINEKEINAKLTKELAKAKASSNGKPIVEKMIVNLRNSNGGEFLVYAELEVPGINAKTGLVGHVKMVNDRPKIVVTDFNLGKLPLPKALNQRVEQLLNIMVNIELADLPLTVTNVEIKNRQLTVTGLTKPAQ